MRVRHILGLVFGLVGTIPVLIIGLALHAYLGDRIERDIADRNLVLARSVYGQVAAVLGQPLATIEALVGVLAHVPSDRWGTLETREILRSPLSRSEGVESIFLLDGTGALVNVGLPPGLEARVDDLIGLSVARHESFLAVFRSGGVPFWSDVFSSLLTGRPSLAVSVRAGNGVLVGIINVTWLDKILQEVGRLAETQAMIVDGHGVLILSADHARDQQRPNLGALEVVRKGLAGIEGTYQYQDRGEWRLGSVVRVPETGWLVIVSQPRDHALAVLWYLSWLVLVGVTAGLGLAFVAAFFVAARVTRPLSQLADDAKRIASGQGGAGLQSSRYAEVDSLAREFNRMGETVRMRENQLRESEGRLRTVIDSLPAAVSLKGLDGAYLLVNRVFEDWRRSEGSTKHVVDLENGERFRAADREVINGRSAVEFEEWIGRELQERRVCLRVVKFPIASATGEIIGIGTVAADITESKIIEETLKRSQRIDALEQLVGGIAHDFNNLLTVIISNLGILDETVPAADGSKKLLASTLRSAWHGADLTKRLLRFSRREISVGTLTDINAALREMEEIAPGVVSGKIQTVFDLADDAWPSEIDRGDFEDAILNLVLNARDAMPEGGTLTISTRNVVIERNAGTPFMDCPPGAYVQIAVEDTGVGMTSDVLERVFEPFFSTKPFGQGSGLGLSMVYGFVHRAKGAIAIASTPAAGTVVRIALPRASTAAGREEKGVRGEEVKDAASGTILLVEDLDDLRESVAHYLTKQGHRVLPAANATQALAMLADGTPVDLLFSDIVMPDGVSGVNLARLVSESRPDIKILLTTGYSDAPKGIEGADPIPFDILTKPYRLAELVKKIQTLLNRQA